MPKIIDIKLGEELVLRHKRRSGGGAPKGGGTGQKKAPLPADWPPPWRYRATKKQGLLTVYDLGTRLNQIGGVAEYQEIPFDALAGEILAYPYLIDIPEAVQFAFDAQALQGQPFGTTVLPGSGRKVSNCMALPYETGPIDLDIYFKGVELVGRLQIIGHDRTPVENLGGEGIIIASHDGWKQRAGAPADASESWTAQMIEEGEAFDTGYVDFKNQDFPPGHLRVRSRLAFEEFDTSDTTNFKITSEPDFLAPAVGFNFKPTVRYELWVKPKYLVWWPGRDWTWTRPITVTPPGGTAPSPGLLRGSGGLVLGPYAARLPIIPKLRSFFFGSTGYADWLPTPDLPPLGPRGAILYAKLTPTRLASQPSSAIHYAVMGGSTRYFSGFITDLSIDPYIPQVGAAAALNAAATAASENTMAAMRAAGYTVEATGPGAITIADVDGFAAWPAAFTPVGALCAVIRRGSSFFYIWRATQLDRTMISTEVGMVPTGLSNADGASGLVRA